MRAAFSEFHGFLLCPFSSPNDGSCSISYVYSLCHETGWVAGAAGAHAEVTERDTRALVLEFPELILHTATAESLEYDGEKY